MNAPWAVGLGLENSLIRPAVVIRPILFALLSVNQRLPSKPAVIDLGALFAVVVANSVIVPAVVIRPILLAPCSANHSAPSTPAVMPKGWLLAVGIGNS